MSSDKHSDKLRLVFTAPFPLMDNSDLGVCLLLNGSSYYIPEEVIDRYVPDETSDSYRISRYQAIDQFIQRIKTKPEDEATPMTIEFCKEDVSPDYIINPQNYGKKDKDMVQATQTEMINTTAGKAKGVIREWLNKQVDAYAKIKRTSDVRSVSSR